MKGQNQKKETKKKKGAGKARGVVAATVTTDRPAKAQEQQGKA